MLKEIDCTKVRMARQLRRLSMDQLVTLMGEHSVSKMAISKIERGLIQPAEHTLLAIADACDVPIDFFYKKRMSIGYLEFRFKTGTPVKKRQAIKAQVVAAVQDYMEKYFNIPDQTVFSNPLQGIIVSNYPDIECATRILRQKWNIGLQPIVSVYELLQNYGINIVEVDIEDSGIIGVSTYVNGTIPIVVINSRNNNTTERKRFTALHELAHLLLQFNIISDEAFSCYLQRVPISQYKVTLKLPDVERLCECFACSMLLPEDCVIRRFGKNRINIMMEELINVRQLYGISIAAIIHRLHILRIIDDVHYHKYFEEIISPNQLEIGFGEYPIMETADGIYQLAIRLKDIS